MSEKLTTEDVEELIEASNRQIREETSVFYRYIADEIDWRDRLVCIMGARGVGKTTIMRQRLRDEYGEDSGRAIYASLDDLWFSRHELKDLVEHLCEHGYSHLFLDEVHRLGKNWSLVMKNIADQFRNINIVYSGSSLLHLEKAKGDLSRRQAAYTLRGLSLREYLKLEGLLDVAPISLEALLSDHVRLASEMDRRLKILPHFETYLKTGYYPFYRESRGRFRERLAETVNKVLDDDYPSLYEVSMDTIRKTRRMLMVLAESCPQTPNMSRLYRELETGRDQGLKMLGTLQKAGLVSLVDAKGMKLDSLSKPEKIYVDNTNLMSALVPRVDIGVKRETFFLNLVRMGHSVAYTGVGDFVVDGKWTFEIGGKGKGFSQIANVPDSFVVNDDVSVGHGNKIPLWLFGFLY